MIRNLYWQLKILMCRDNVDTRLLEVICIFFRVEFLVFPFRLCSVGN